MELPTYTSIWRIEKRLYKLYDFRLPMPLPVGQIVVFTAITLPYVLLLTLFGLPFDHTMFWAYVLPPGVLTWLATRPVLESKRLPELIMSQVRYLGEPSRWCRMAPLAEKDQVVVVARVWRRAELIPAADPAPPAAAETGTATAAVRARPAGQPLWPGVAAPAAPARGQVRAVAAPAPRTVARAGRVSAAATPDASAAGRVRARAAHPSRHVRAAAERPVRVPPAMPAAAPPPVVPQPGVSSAVTPPSVTSAVLPAPLLTGPTSATPTARPPAVIVPPPPAEGRLEATKVPLPPAEGRPPAGMVPLPLAEGRWPAVKVPPPPAGERPPAGMVPPPPAGGHPAAGEMPVSELPPTPGEMRDGELRPPAGEDRAVDMPPAGEGPLPAVSAAPAISEPPAAPARGPGMPSVTVVPAQRPQASAAPARPGRPVEQVLSGPHGQRRANWRDHVVVVPGGLGPGRPDNEKRDRARAVLSVSGPRVVTVLGCTVGAGQTVTSVIVADLLARLRGETIAALDLNPGPASLTGLAANGSVVSLSTLLADPGPAEAPGPPASQRHAAPHDRQPGPGQSTRARGRLDVIAPQVDGNGTLAMGDLEYRGIFDALTARYPLVLTDPGASAVARVLAVTDQLVLVAPASPDAARALAMTQEWLSAHGHDTLCANSVAVLNGLSKRSMPHAEQAELVIRGRCRAIVRVPWDDHLAEPANERSIRDSFGPSGTQSLLPQLRPPVLQAYTALAGVLIASLAASPQRRRAAP